MRFFEGVIYKTYRVEPLLQKGILLLKRNYRWILNVIFKYKESYLFINNIGSWIFCNLFESIFPRMRIISQPVEIYVNVFMQYQTKIVFLFTNI